jgi:hypothetical protein
MVSMTVVLALILASISHISYIRAEEFTDDDSSEAETHYKLMDTHHLEFPSTKEFFDLWQTFGTSLILKDRIIIVPEVQDKKGAI